MRQTRDFGARSGQQVPVPNSSGAVSKRARGPRVNYFETNEFQVDAGVDDVFSMKCPRHNIALNGYFGTDVAGAVLDNSAVGGSLRVWQFAILNLNDSESVNYFTGIVCAKGL